MASDNKHLPVTDGIVSRDRYAVNSIFKTYQGEGSRLGRLATFVRFAGCNLWSGREETRLAETPNGSCVRFCDTDFAKPNGANGGVLTFEELVRRVLDMTPEPDALIVFTGGEPLLQLSQRLVDVILQNAKGQTEVVIETNGVLPPLDKAWNTHYALAPKPPAPLAQQYKSHDHLVQFDCLKLLLVPGTSALPLDIPPYAKLLGQSVYLQPVDGIPMQECLEEADRLRKALLRLGYRNSDIRLGVQAHKVWELP
jgi:organic radical activating enzyme